MALRLARSGAPVYASARNVSALEALAAAGCRTLALDVTDESSMAAAVATVEADEGAVGVLVNNAGYSQSGAVESVPVEAARRQFEANLFGPMRLIQLVLPGMRHQRWGRIVNVSSIAGRLTLPGGGLYHASKHALEALSDALRLELASFGVDVVVVQPGIIRTGFSEAAVEAIAGIPPGGPYEAFNAAVAASTLRAYQRGPLARLGGSPEAVARVVERAISARRPRARYAVTPSAHLLLAARRVLPDRTWDALVSRTYPRPGESET